MIYEPTQCAKCERINKHSEMPSQILWWFKHLYLLSSLSNRPTNMLCVSSLIHLEHHFQQARNIRRDLDHLDFVAL